MNSRFSGNPKPFGIIGLVLAIISFLISIIPCVGFYAIIPSIMAIFFCGMAFFGLKERNESTGVPFAGLLIGTLAVSIGIFQYYKYKTVFDAKAEIENSINGKENEIRDTIEKKVLEHVKENILKEIEKDSIQKINNDSIQQ